MPRQSAAHKRQSRETILKEAGQAFRARGYKGTTVPDVMERAGMTVGGFYRHFDSKDALFREAFADSLESTRRLLEKARNLPAEQWFAVVADRYLTEAHRDNVQGGCPLPALLSDAARSDTKSRALWEPMLEELVAEAVRATGCSRGLAWAYFSMLVGGLSLSRAVADPERSAEILAGTRQSARSFGVA